MQRSVTENSSKRSKLLNRKQPEFNSEMALRWGIASAGKISHDFLVALSTLSDDDHQVVAVAARDKDRAERFRKLHGITRSYGSYEELATDPEVDVVYVGSINPQHYEISRLMLENGKHVLCEKPLCMNEKQVRKLISYGERKGKFLMEAIWSRFFPAYQYARKQIETGVLGDILEVEISFGFDIQEVDRVAKKLLGGGTVLDLGVYTIQLSQWVFREPPKSIEATAELNSEGVDIDVKATLKYANGSVSKIHFSGKEQLPNVAVIKGSKGTITIKSFWCPTTIVDIDGKERTWPLPEAKLGTNFINSVGLRYEAEEVRRCINEGVVESERISHNESLIISQIEDEIRRQIGVSYEED